MSANLKRLGILRGGTGEYYSSSLAKGGGFISYINENLSDKFKVLDIFIDKNYIWHLGGIPLNPGELTRRVDAVWNLSHPSFGNILQSLSIPHISNGIFIEKLKNDKKMLESHVKNIGIKMPRHIILSAYDEALHGSIEEYARKKAKEILHKFPAPWIVSIAGDASMIKTFPELVSVIARGAEKEASITVEEHVRGKSASLYSLSSFRNKGIYVFPIVDSRKVFSQAEKEKLHSLAEKLHSHSGAGYYLRSDFVMDPYGKTYLSNIESTLDLDSDFVEACGLVSTTPHHIIGHFVTEAINT